ncbi:NmrA family protein [Klebsiella pneumoniae]|jgi:NAD(P)H dehydrogenase (quinone)|uniref:NAD(P)-dependent oxidoreductase n=7 Tax=Enterobacteriaceae TaxID=543 RepID=A0A2L1KT90_KLEPN|nr:MULTISPECIES: SDR family oxidoreductase [Enterobacteriaceae]HAV1775761.1 SDR family oxidoreductase [Enterobacter hormaechei subsp. xiangfangensis]HCA9670954.1 SDR family oxidoreductase [Klebsiella variicola subsp. variicola]HDH1376379.1 SDR family oxidoreductase [Klebsiella quasipneumoniae subsp. similipneumoniae]HDS4611596.1 SDR family oxidoreductase [Klebsiella pneumoniae subsp. ozaenae]HDU5785058.1 SDR family oxidoreductase [Klebsiella pneumoniae subsp. pneumoniae]HDW0092809.1 SDR famil
MTIAITGATGHLGQLVIEKLKQKVDASEIVALVRTPAKAAGLGVATREADYTRQDTLDVALKGVDTLLLISGNEIGQRAVQHENVIRAAVKNGVKRIVYTSLLHADKSPLNLAPEHVQTEQALKNSGLDYTILRNGWYSENYTGSIAPALGLGAFYGSAGEGKISSAPREDYAEAAVVALTGQGHEGKTYELAGDEFYTLTDLAAEITAQSGKDIPYRNIPEADYAAALKNAGLPDGFAEAIASWDTGASQNALFDDSHVLSKLIGRKTTPIAVSVQKALA